MTLTGSGFSASGITEYLCEKYLGVVKIAKYQCFFE